VKRPVVRSARRRRAVVGVVFALLTSGCAYYNGMYNARRYAKQAESSERAGRMSEAAERWRLAEIHAESLTARHPHSRWADDAKLIRGRALLHLTAYNDAVVVLLEAVREAEQEPQRREASLYLGEANLAIGRLPEALEALDTAVIARDKKIRDEAYLYRGRTWMALRRPGRALADFLASESIPARFERVRAALALDDGDLAAAFADSLTVVRYREAEWTPLLDSLTRAGLSGRVSGLVDALLRRGDVPRGARARMLLADGDRALVGGNDSAAAGRFHAVVRLVPDSVEGRGAAVRLARLDLRAAQDTVDLARVSATLRSLAALGGTPGQDARDLLRLLDRSDSLAAAVDHADAYWLLRAELLRDSLGARTLAAATFADMARRFPDSPWTPKGLLAAIIGGYPAADSLRDLLRQRYPDSPYTLLLDSRRDAPERFAALEDSLRLTLAPAREVNASEEEAAPGQGVRRGRDVPGLRNRERQRPTTGGPPQPIP